MLEPASITPPPPRAFVVDWKAPKAQDNSYPYPPVRGAAFGRLSKALPVTMAPSVADMPLGELRRQTRPGVMIAYDTEASLVEGALRDNLKSLGWVTPEDAARASALLKDHVSVWGSSPAVHETLHILKKKA